MLDHDASMPVLQREALRTTFGQVAQTEPDSRQVAPGAARVPARGSTGATGPP
jgi:hypothetical protein